jgi:mRNA-degrading endonuclease RelE of RelBE toxin-antitoxin system
MKVEVSEQVAAFVRRQAPEPRRRLRLALRRLASERGDIRALEGPLRGYHRLRVGPFRVVFATTADTGQPACIHCLFAERRDIVYTVFSRVLQRNILKR